MKYTIYQAKNRAKAVCGSLLFFAASIAFFGAVTLVQYERAVTLVKVGNEIKAVKPAGAEPLRWAGWGMIAAAILLAVYLIGKYRKMRASAFCITSESIEAANSKERHSFLYRDVEMVIKKDMRTLSVVGKGRRIDVPYLWDVDAAVEAAKTALERSAGEEHPHQP